GTVDVGLREGATVAAKQDVTITVAEPRASQRLAWALSRWPTAAVITALLVLLLGLVRRARRDDPFSLATVRRLRVLGVVALGGYVASLLELMATMLLSGTVTTDGVAGGSQLSM